MQRRYTTLTAMGAGVVMLFAFIPAATATDNPLNLPPDDAPPIATATVVYDMIFPIVGTVNYTDTFGACRSGCSRTHQGIDMLAAKMTPIVAVADGIVGWMHNDQGGNCCAMALNHDDGWETYYIHMNNDTFGTDDGQGWGFAEGIESGAHVTAGQLIGWVGDSGNAESAPSHLHFELHKPNGAVINPYPSLQVATVLSAPGVEVSPRGCDFNGDGYHDLTIGTPGEDLGTGGIRTDAGSVTVLYGSAGGVSTDGAEMWHYNQPGVTGGLRSDARFGAATACGDFDDDGYDDLVIGAPGRIVNQIDGGGAVTVLEGSAGGLQATGSNLWHLGKPGVVQKPDSAARFGSALVSGDFNADGYDDVAVGAPNKLRNTKEGAGIVVVLLGSAAGIDGTSTFLADGIGALPGNPETSDGFGASLATADFDSDGRDDLVIGIPNESGNVNAGTGEVIIVPGGDDVFDKSRARRLFAPAAGWVTTATGHFGAALATGDLNGDDIPDLVVAAPGDIANGTDAGSIRVFNGGGTQLVRSSNSVEISQASSGVPGSAASGTMLGAALVIGDFNADGYDDIAIGVPFATISGEAGAGSVVTIEGSNSGLDTASAELLHQNNLQVFWNATADTWFGSYLASGDYADVGGASLAIGVPGQLVGLNEDAGAVHVVYGGLGGLSLTGVDAWRENLSTVPGKAEPNDGLGVLGSGAGLQTP